MALTRQELERDRQMAQGLFRRLAAPPPRTPAVGPHAPLPGQPATEGGVHASDRPAGFH